MRVSDLGQYLLVCHEIDALLLCSTYLAGRQVLKCKELCLFNVGDETQKLNETINTIPNLKARRYFDKFYLWTPENNDKRRQYVLDRFFELIANEYESLIDVERNLDNIRNLFWFLDRLMDPLERATVVDYGCATGLSIRLATKLDIKLIGFDRCLKMRQIASGRGMIVWSTGELARQPKGSLDGAFASYVFHLLPNTYGLRLLWARLKQGGVIVANFHKNQGTEVVGACIHELKGSVQHLRSPIGSERHGVYVAYRKER